MTSRMDNFERDSLAAVLRSKRVWLVHVVANAALLVAFFYWTRIPDENGAQFALSVIGGLLIAFFTLCLHSGTFEFFASGASSSFLAALRRVTGRIPAFLIWALVFGLVLWAIGLLWGYDAQAGGWARHALPEFLRRHVKPRTMITLAAGAVGFLFYFLWPILFLPAGAEVAIHGWRGFFGRARWRPICELRFWIAYAVCFVVGGYLPYKLVWMTPKTPSSLRTEQVSAVLRIGFGYLLLVTAWLVLCAAIVWVTSADEAQSAESQG